MAAFNMHLFEHYRYTQQQFIEQHSRGLAWI